MSDAADQDAARADCDRINRTGHLARPEDLEGLPGMTHDKIVVLKGPWWALA